MTQALAIYAGHSRRPFGPPRPQGAVASPPPRAVPRLELVPRDPDDTALLAVLDAPPVAGETIDVEFRRKERDLLARFAALPVDAALALHKRLSTPRDGDELAARFARLVADRRARLLEFLADARRREAIKGGRRG
jgi:hypothetical protein